MSVTPDRVAVELGRSASDLTPEERQQWESWIEGARLVIRARLGDLENLDQDVLDWVVIQAVALRVKYPDPTTSKTVQVDDGLVTERYDRATGQITILDEWWELLSPISQVAAFSTRPGFQPDYAARPYQVGHPSRWWRNR